jgi:hypothetical protein
MTKQQVASVLGTHASAVRGEVGADVVAVLAFVDGSVTIGSYCPDVETLVLLLERTLRDVRGQGLRIIDKRRPT